MSNSKIYTKEDIKDRMFRNAANFWGVRNVENLDPLVKLLTEAFASEIYKLSNEVNNIETRILERTANMLTPDILMSVRPAHLILQAQPSETKGYLDKNKGFYLDDSIFDTKYKVKNVSFYPVSPVSLVQGAVRALVCGGNLYVYDKSANKEIVSRSTQRSDTFAQDVWIGLELDEDVDFVEDLTFYFDFLNIEIRAEYLHLLSFTQWRHRGELLETNPGFFSPKQDLKNKSIYTEYDLSNISDNSILAYYDHQFITLKSKLRKTIDGSEIFPQELKPLFSNDAISHLQNSKPLIWLKVSFPPNFNKEILNAITIAINAFPAVNKNLKKQYVKISKLTNVIPLATEPKEYFLSVNSVVNSEGKKYEQLPYYRSDSHQTGTYSLKRSGIERFDSRNAKEYILNLIDLLRDEGVAYSIIGKGFLGSMTTQLEGLIAMIDQRINAVDEKKEIPSYIILDSDDKNETIFVDYWITHSEVANEIKSGAFFVPYSDTFTEQDNVISLTSSIGGRGAPKSDNILDIYKYILTSRDRIYTSEDIINYCYSTYGDLFSSVEVKKGIEASSKPKEGLVRTIDVFIETGVDYQQLFPEQEVGRKLINELKRKSPDAFNYRIFINNQQS